MVVPAITIILSILLLSLYTGISQSLGYFPEIGMTDITLDFYKKILKLSKDFINKSGRLYLEIGYDQAKEVVDLAKKEGYYNIQIIKDLSGRDRGISMSVD